MRDSIQKGKTWTLAMLGPDPVLVVAVFLILAIGVVMVTSAGYILAVGKFGDGFYYAKKQAVAMALGLLLMYVFSLVQPEFWKRAAVPLLVVGIFLLVLVAIPGIGVELGGSRRWIKLAFGFYLQPSELTKYALIIFLARQLDKKGPKLTQFTDGFLPNIVVTALVVALVLLQPDFGTAVITCVVGVLMLFVGGVRMRHLLYTSALCVPILVYVAVSAQYRWYRLMSFLDPWSDPFKSGFQIIQSLLAFGCGGYWGVGIGKGIQKLFYLPQPHTDFIFAVVGEELGFFGVLVLILLFYVIVCRGLAVAIRSKDNFQRYLAFGITSLIGLQATVNMAVAMGILPTKGLPLPLVSLGGTSLVMTLAGMGILLSIASRTELNRKEAGS